MINEDDVALTNLDVETPSPLSSPTDRSSNGEEENSTVDGSSSGGSSPSDLRKRLQSLPSRSEVTRLADRATDIGRRPSRKRDSYFYLRGAASRIEEKDESEENNEVYPVPLRKKSSRDLRVRNPRERRRARIRSEASKVEGKMWTAPVHESFGTTVDLTETSQPSLIRCPRSTMKRHLAPNSAHDVELVEIQKSSYTPRVHSHQPSEDSPKDRVEFPRLSPIGLSSTRPTKFGGYRPLAGVVLKNLSSGSESESNSPVAPNVALHLQGADRLTVYAAPPVANNALPGWPDRNNAPIAMDYSVITPSSSARRSTSCRNSDRQLSDISEDEIPESGATSPNFEMGTEASVRMMQKSSALGQAMPCQVYPAFNSSRSGKKVKRLPILSTRSNICEYNKRLDVSASYTSRTVVTREFSDCQLRKVASSGKSSHDTLDKLTAQGNEISSDSDGRARVSCILPRSNNLSRHSSCTKSYDNEEYNGSETEKYFPKEGANLELSARVIEAQTSENFHGEDIESTRKNDDAASTPDANYVEVPKTNRESSKESYKYNDELSIDTKYNRERSDNTCEINDVTRVPTLILNSQEMSQSISPVTIQDAKQQLLDADVLIKALSNVPLNESTAELNGNLEHSHGNVCDETNLSTRRTLSKEDSTIEDCKDGLSLKLRSKIPIKVPDRKLRLSSNGGKFVSPLEEALLFDHPKNLTTKTIFVNPNEQVSPNLSPQSRGSRLSCKRKYKVSHLQESNESLSSQRSCSTKSLSQTVIAKLPSSAYLHLNNQSARNITQNCDDARSSAEKEYSLSRGLQGSNHSNLEQLEVKNNANHLVKEENENFDNTKHKNLLENSQSGDFVVSVPSVNQKNCNFSNFQTNDSVPYFSEDPLSNRECHSEADNFYFKKVIANSSVSSSDTVSAKKKCDFENSKRKFNAEEELKSDHNKLQELSNIDDSPGKNLNKFSLKVNCVETTVSSGVLNKYEANQGLAMHENNNISFKNQNETTTNENDVEYLSDIGDMKHRDHPAEGEDKSAVKAYEITADKEFNDDKKVRLSIERLAVEQFRKNICSERAKAVQSDNVAFLPEKRPETLALPIRFSSSTSKLYRASDGTNYSPRFKKKSQDRFPFTISEKTSVASAKYKCVSARGENRNLEKNSLSSEKTYKLSMHPSITRLAGSGVEDTPAEITKCLAHNDEETSRNRLPGMRGFVQRFSARLRRSGKKRKKDKRNNEPTNVIYENSAYRENSVGNTCSESSVADKFEDYLSKKSAVLPGSLEEKPPVLCDTTVSKNEKTEEASSSPGYPRRRYDRDDMWVEAFKDAKSNQQDEIEKEKDPSTARASLNDPCSMFFIQNTSHSTDTVEKVPCASGKKDRGNPLRRKLNRVRVSDSLPVIFKSSTGDMGEKGSRDRYIINDENEKDTESDCFCSRFCGMISRMSSRFQSTYQSTINRRDSRPALR